jgi:hypothetical protein
MLPCPAAFVVTRAWQESDVDLMAQLSEHEYDRRSRRVEAAAKRHVAERSAGLSAKYGTYTATEDPAHSVFDPIAKKLSKFSHHHLNTVRENPFVSHASAAHQPRVGGGGARNGAPSRTPRARYSNSSKIGQRK